MKRIIKTYKAPENCEECHLFSRGTFDDRAVKGWKMVMSVNKNGQERELHFDPTMFEGVCQHIFNKYMKKNDVKNTAWKPGSDEPCNYQILLDTKIEPIPNETKIQ